MRSSGNSTVLLCRTLQVSWLEVQLPRKLAASVCTDTTESSMAVAFLGTLALPQEPEQVPRVFITEGISQNHSSLLLPQKPGLPGFVESHLAFEFGEEKGLVGSWECSAHMAAPERDCLLFVPKLNALPTPSSINALMHDDVSQRDRSKHCNKTISLFSNFRPY